MTAKPSTTGRAGIFLSYAREDADAVQRMAEALRQADVEVWFDQDELRGGDAWDQQIRNQIRTCALFLPIISAATQERMEGYFRREWKLGVERTHDLADGVPFILPIAIDDTPESAAAVPAEFLRVQWTRLPGALPTLEFVAQVKRVLAQPRRPVGTGIPFQGILATAQGAASAPGWSTPAAPAVNEKSVAVLAFANMSHDPENEYFSDGISEELLNVLAKIPGLQVSARTSAFFFKGKNMPIPEIARALGVAHVVEGSVRKAGSRVRITAQLIDAANGFHLWSDTFDRELTDIFALQDEIAREIARNLQVKLGTMAPTAHPVNPEAHGLVLEGRHYWKSRTAEGFARGEAAFRRAIELDPQFAPAHSGLAEVCVARASNLQHEGFGDAADEIRRARGASERAIQLDSSLAEPHAVLGFVLMFEGRLAESEVQFDQALALNPNSALAHSWHGLLQACQGRLDRVLTAYGKAGALDPLWLMNLHLSSVFLYEARRFEEALKVNERVAALRPGIFIPNLGDRAWILMALGRKAEAIEAARGVKERPELGPRLVADNRAIAVLRLAGFEQEASDYAAELFKRWPPETYQRGFVLGALGRFEDALPFLERIPSMVVQALFWNTTWDPWREDPRFLQLMVKLGRANEYAVARETLARMTR